MFKTRNIRNKKHLQVVAGKFHCLLWNVAKHECNGNIQAHHLLKPYEGSRGVGMKAGDVLFTTKNYICKLGMKICSGNLMAYQEIMVEKKQNIFGRITKNGRNKSR